MDRIILSLVSVSALALGSATVALAQDLPTKQPRILTIVREEVKLAAPPTTPGTKSADRPPTRRRTAPKLGFRVYQVVAGMPTPTFLVIASVEDFAAFDETTAAHEATLKMHTADEHAARKEFQTEGVLSWEMNRFKVDPAQSYLSKETRAKDPEFWSPK